MKKPAFIIMFIALYVGLLIILTSCDTKKTETNSAGADSIVTAETARAPISSLDFRLYPLYIETSNFVSSFTDADKKDKKKKLFLQFVIANGGNSNYLSLNGWFPNKPESKTAVVEKFDTDPSVVLARITSASASSYTVAIENGTFLSGFFIDHETVKNMITKAKTPGVEQFIIFFPEIDPTDLKDKKHVRYKIYFLNDKDNPTIPERTRSPDGGANPTPPRQYEIN